MRRPRDAVRRWWTDLPDVYVATDPREQPHRIVTVRRDGAVRDLMTYWRGPFGRTIEVPERLTLQADGNFRFDIELPGGAYQRDEFRLVDEDGGTRVSIEVTIRPRALPGRLTAPLWRAFARRNYPRAWRSAARICERDAR